MWFTVLYRIFSLMKFHLFIFACGIKSKKSFAKTDVKELTAYAFFYNFHGFMSYPLCVWCKKLVQPHSDACGYPVFPTLFAAETILSPFLGPFFHKLIVHIHMDLLLVTLFTIARTWKQPKCPLTEEWIKMWHIYRMEYYSAIKKNEIVKFAEM